MSLINDALKRAKDAQQKSTPAAPSPQLPPAESAPTRGMGMTVPLIIAVVAIIALLFVWKNQNQTAAREVAPTAKAAASANQMAETKPPVAAIAVATPAPPAPASPTPPPVVTTAPVASSPAPELKLQAIFFAPGHSSAIISGKTVRVGNIFKGFRVTAITELSATLVSSTQTNVMTLEQ